MQPTATPTTTPTTTLEILKAGWQAWPSPVIARSEIGTFTGGLIAPRSIANFDCLKKGPKGKIRLGRSVGYEKAALIEWLTARLEA
jgi:hypothetical protein